MKYNNFDIKVVSTDEGSYLVTATSHLRETADSQLTVTGALRKILEQTADEARKEFSIKDFGALLYEILFQGEIGSLFERACVASEESKGRMRLRFCTKAKQIAAIPWELIYERDRNRFLSATDDMSFVRFIERQDLLIDFKLTLPLKVLLMIPRASRLQRHPILTAFQQLDQKMVSFNLLEENLTRLKSIQRDLIEDYQVLHFIASGGCDDEGDYMLLDGDDGAPEQVGAEPLAKQVKESPHLKLVILDCHSAGSNSDPRTLAGLGPQLIRSGLPAVITAQFPMAHQTLIDFAKTFYFEICSGEEPGRVDAAVTRARKCLLNTDNNSKDFAAPVLFTRTSEGLIFYFDRAKFPLFSRR